MNCCEFQNWLQQRLDGEASAAAGDVEGHVVACASCRELQAAAGQLIQALGAQAAPVPPSRMSDQIMSLVLSDMTSQHQARKRWNRRLGVTAALAASLLLAVALGYSWLPSNRKPDRPNPEPRALAARGFDPYPACHGNLATGSGARRRFAPGSARRRGPRLRAGYFLRAPSRQLVPARNPSNGSSETVVTV